MGRFIRIASLVFALLSAFYWIAVWTFVELIYVVDERLVEAGSMIWLSQALPPIIYGVVCVCFCHWFAKQIVRRMKSDSQ